MASADKGQGGTSWKMSVWGIQVMGDTMSEQVVPVQVTGLWTVGGRADHGSAHAPACTPPRVGAGVVDYRADRRDPPASPPSHRQLLLRASATQAAPGLPWEEGASGREEEGGQAARHPASPAPSAERDTRNTQDPTTVNSHGRGLCARHEDSGKEAKATPSQISAAHGDQPQGGGLRREDAAAAKSLQLCLTLCNPIDGSPPGSPVPGILQARTLEWVAISFSNA